MLAAASGCSLLGTSAAPGSVYSQASVRPGVEDSSRAFQGSLSPAETAFWRAVRDGNDDAREAAVATMKADIAANPADGYTPFVTGASSLIPDSSLVRALAAGEHPRRGGGSRGAGPLFTRALEHLTDPLYIGFADILQSFVQLRSGDAAAAARSRSHAFATNVPAASVGLVIGQLSAGDTAGALDTMSNMLDFCNGTPLDRANPDLGGFVDKANAGAMVHRECYSGYFGPHATEGELLIVGDLHAATGNPKLAMLYYRAAMRATTFATWPLRPLVERRIRGAQPAETTDLPAIAACTTCHTNTLP